MTFSIAAYDKAAQAWGVAVASKFLAAGALVTWAETSAGAVATQAFVNVSFGPQGLALMKSGLSAEETLAKLLAKDENAEDRQVGMVDAKGNAAAHTGEDCFEYAGHIVGDGFTCQGNILVGKQVLEAMAQTFRASAKSGVDLADRLVEALRAGDLAGGDSRGRQAAAVVVVKPNGGYGGDNDLYINLRVDDHPDPVVKLAELVELHHLYFGKSDLNVHLPIDHALATELQTLMTKLGHYTGAINGEWDEPSLDAFWSLVGVENLEERWSPDEHPELLDPVILKFLRDRFA